MAKGKSSEKKKSNKSKHQLQKGKAQENISETDKVKIADEETVPTTDGSTSQMEGTTSDEHKTNIDKSKTGLDNRKIDDDALKTEASKSKKASNRKKSKEIPSSKSDDDDNLPKPLILNPEIFKFLYNYGKNFHQKQPVILSFETVITESFNPEIKPLGKDKNVPPYCAVFCMQHVQMPLYQPLGTVFYYSCIKAEKFVEVIKIYIRDLYKCNFIVVSTLSSINTFLSSVIQCLTGIDEFSNEALVYQTEHSDVIVHLFDPTTLLKQTRLFLLNQNIMYQEAGQHFFADMEEFRCAVRRKGLPEGCGDYILRDFNTNIEAIRFFSTTVYNFLSQNPCKGCIYDRPEINTATIIWFFDCLYDTFNGDILNSENAHILNNKKLRVNPNTNSAAYKFWQESLVWFKDMYVLYPYHNMDPLLTERAVSIVFWCGGNIRPYIQKYYRNKDEINLEQLSCDMYHIRHLEDVETHESEEEGYTLGEQDYNYENEYNRKQQATNYQDENVRELVSQAYRTAGYNTLNTFHPSTIPKLNDDDVAQKQNRNNMQKVDEIPDPPVDVKSNASLSTMELKKEIAQKSKQLLKVIMKNDTGPEDKPVAPNPKIARKITFDEVPSEPSRKLKKGKSKIKPSKEAQDKTIEQSENVTNKDSTNVKGSNEKIPEENKTDKKNKNKKSSFNENKIIESINRLEGFVKNKIATNAKNKKTEAATSRETTTQSNRYRDSSQESTSESDKQVDSRNNDQKESIENNENTEDNNSQQSTVMQVMSDHNYSKIVDLKDSTGDESAKETDKILEDANKKTENENKEATKRKSFINLTIPEEQDGNKENIDTTNVPTQQENRHTFDVGGSKGDVFTTDNLSNENRSNTNSEIAKLIERNLMSTIDIILKDYQKVSPNAERQMPFVTYNESIPELDEELNLRILAEEAVKSAEKRYKYMKSAKKEYKYTKSRRRVTANPIIICNPKSSASHQTAEEKLKLVQPQENPNTLPSKKQKKKKKHKKVQLELSNQSYDEMFEGVSPKKSKTPSQIKKQVDKLYETAAFIDMNYPDPYHDDINLSAQVPFAFSCWIVTIKGIMEIVEYLEKAFRYPYIRTKSFKLDMLDRYLFFVRTERNGINELYGFGDVEGDLINEFKARLAFEKESSVIIYPEKKWC